jgi:hypothetical protein
LPLLAPTQRIAVRCAVRCIACWRYITAVCARSRMGRSRSVGEELGGPAQAVQRARAAGYTWAAIGGLLGTTGQAASQRYGRRVKA